MCLLKFNLEIDFSASYLSKLNLSVSNHGTIFVPACLMGLLHYCSVLGMDDKMERAMYSSSCCNIALMSCGEKKVSEYNMCLYSNTKFITEFLQKSIKCKTERHKLGNNIKWCKSLIIFVFMDNVQKRTNKSSPRNLT